MTPRSVACLFAALVLFIAVFNGFSWTLGHSYAAEARRFSDGAPEVRGPAWLAAARFEAALRLSPEDGRHLEDRGVFHEAHAASLDPLDPSAARAERQRAKDWLSRAALTRPTWYVPDLHLLWIHQAELDAGDPFLERVFRVADLAPREPGAQAVLMQVLFTFGRGLPEEARGLALRTTIAGLTHAAWQQRERTETFVTRTSGWDQVCGDAQVRETWPEQCSD